MYVVYGSIEKVTYIYTCNYSNNRAEKSIELLERYQLVYTTYNKRFTITGARNQPVLCFSTIYRGPTLVLLLLECCSDTVPRGRSYISRNTW